MPAPESATWKIRAHYLKPEELSRLAKIPILIMFGDHLGDIPGPLGSLRPNAFDACNQVRPAG
jgi:hypothetical protein